MNGELVFDVTVQGKPRPQGSMKLLGAGGGRPRLRYSDTTVDHRNLVITRLAAQWRGRQPLDGPLAVRAVFVFPRPQSHFGTGRNAGVVKASAPVFHAQTPDADKLARLVGDALVIAGVIADDALITVFRSEKRWGDAPGATAIEVWRLIPSDG